MYIADINFIFLVYMLADATTISTGVKLTMIQHTTLAMILAEAEWKSVHQQVVVGFQEHDYIQSTVHKNFSTNCCDYMEVKVLLKQTCGSV